MYKTLDENICTPMHVVHTKENALAISSYSLYIYLPFWPGSPTVEKGLQDILLYPLPPVIFKWNCPNTETYFWR